MLPVHALRLVPIAVAVTGIIACSREAPPEQPASERQQYSYAVGRELAAALEPRRGELDLQQLHRAIDDALGPQGARIDAVQARHIIQAYEASHQAALRQQQRSLAERNLAEGKSFLERNGQRPGVRTTPGGAQYEVLVEGEGPRPIETDQVLLHYKGMLLDGTVFDDSHDKPQPLAVQLPLSPPGWREVLPLMPIGSKYRVYLPGPLAHGEQGLGLKVPPQAATIYEIELLGVVR